MLTTPSKPVLRRALKNWRHQSSPVTVADGAEGPGAFEGLVPGTNLEQAVECGLVGVDAGVLGVHVPDAARETLDHDRWFHALGPEVAGIQVGAEQVAGDFAKLQEGARIVGDHAVVHFDGDLHAVVGGEAAGFTPKRE